MNPVLTPPLNGNERSSSLQTPQLDDLLRKCALIGQVILGRREQNLPMKGWLKELKEILGEDPFPLSGSTTDRGGRE